MSLEDVPLKSLKEVTKYLSRGITPSYTENEGVIVLNQRCIRDNKIDWSNIRLTDPQKKKISSDKYLKQYDVLVNSTGVGTLGRSAQVKKLFSDTTVDSHVTILRPNDLVDPMFFGYAVNMVEKNIESLAEGSTGQTELSRVRLGEEIFINLPPKDIQKKIAKILSYLDEKIELNEKINKNLNAILDLIIGEIINNSPSNGLKTFKIDDLPLVITDYVANGSFTSLKENVSILDTEDYAYFIRNTDLKSRIFEKYVDKHSYDFLKKSSLYGNEIIISNVGDVGSVYLCPFLDKPMTLGNNMIMVKSKDKESYLNFYLYLLFKSEYGQYLLSTITTGSVQLKFNKTMFRSLEIVIPTEEKLTKFNKIVNPIFEQIIINQEAINKLQKLRDTLLPKLMSGEIDVSKINYDLE